MRAIFSQPRANFINSRTKTKSAIMNALKIQPKNRNPLRRLDDALGAVFFDGERSLWDIHVFAALIFLRVYTRLSPFFPPLYKIIPRKRRENDFNLQFRHVLYDWATELEPLPEYPQYFDGPDFNYIRLPDKSSIRIIHLQPGPLDSPIICSMSIHHIDDLPLYEALSYTWGSPVPAFLISCDGVKMEVAENLWHALHRLRRTDQSRALWIDAICINQDDVEERGYQVTMIRSILAGASRVVVWLGEASKDSAGAVRLIKNIATSEAMAQASSQTRALTEDDFATLGLPNDSRKDWTPLDKLFSRPWFSRVWIIQEIILSTSATILVGGDEVSWNDTSLAASHLTRTNISSLVGVSTDTVLSLNAIGWRYHNETRTGLSGLPLLVLLERTRRNMSTLRDDKVYSLLGLSSDSDRLGISPDYNLSANDLYINIATTHLKSGDLDILNSNGDLFWKSCHRIPTWVPDWPSYRREAAFVVEGRSLYCADNHASDLEISEDSRTLRISGLEIDVVVRVGDARINIDQRNLTRSANPKLERWRQRMYNSVGYAAQVTMENSRRARLWQKIGMSLKSYPTGEDVASAYYRTIAAGVVPQDSTPQSLEKVYRLYYLDYGRNMSANGMVRPGQENVDKENYEQLVRYGSAVFSATQGRRLFVTKKGYLGLCPRSTRLGDKVVVLFGGKTPYILRKVKKGQHEFLGECYVHGLMNGEASGMGYVSQKFAVI